jgi:hypothetical protein
MKALRFRRQLTLTVLALMAAGVMAARAGRIRRIQAVGTCVFQVATNAGIEVGTNRLASLGDVRVGDRISIRYDREDGVLVAKKLADGVPRKPRNPGTNAVPVTHHASGAKGLAVVHGVVQSIDDQAGTLSITYSLRQRL